MSEGLIFALAIVIAVISAIGITALYDYKMKKMGVR